MFAAICYLFLTYLVAAVPVGVVLTALFGGDEDIRREGSGNIGATNVARVHGWGLAVPVMILDVCKGLLPVLIAGWGWPELSPGLGLAWRTAVGGAAFLGHCYPVYLAFHGGKGVATGAGAMLALAPTPTLLAVATWAVALAVSGRSSVASLVATLALVAVMAVLAPGALPAAILLAVGVVVSHTQNIRRLVAGDEAAILRPVRWGRSAEAPQDDPAASLERGPGGPGAAAPALWRPAADHGHDDEDPAEPPEPR